MKKRWLLLIFGVLTLLPLIVTVTNSFMSETEVALVYTSKRSLFDLADGIVKKFITFRLIPREATFSQYAQVLLFSPSFLRLLANSVKIAVPVTAGNVFVSLFTAYGFTVWRWRYKEALFFVYIVVMLLPLQAVLVPHYIVADKLKITDSYAAIIMPGIFAPFGPFLLRQSMKSLPVAQFEAARVDGARDLRLLLYIVLPQMKAGIAALAMLLFIEYWNVVEQSVVFIRDYYREPLSVYLSRMADSGSGLVFAASCVYMFVPLWLLAYGRPYLEQGIELSGVK